MTLAIAAIPTLYRGTRYQSRLEARWAAFFHMVRWQFVYEPYDLDKWSPDFLLKGKTPVLGRVLINLRQCPLRSDTDRLCATAANVAMGQEQT